MRPEFLFEVPGPHVAAGSVAIVHDDLQGRFFSCDRLEALSLVGIVRRWSAWSTRRVTSGRGSTAGQIRGADKVASRHIQIDRLHERSRTYVHTIRKFSVRGRGDCSYVRTSPVLRIIPSSVVALSPLKSTRVVLSPTVDAPE